MIINSNGVNVLTEDAATNINEKANRSDLVGLAKISTGTYSGTGTTKESNPNSLTFDFEPENIMISRSDHSFLRGNYSMSHTFGINWDQIPTDSYATITAYRADKMYVKKSGNTLYWYSTNAESQLNTSGSVYHWIAWGKRGENE